MSQYCANIVCILNTLWKTKQMTYKKEINSACLPKSVNWTLTISRDLCIMYSISGNECKLVYISMNFNIQIPFSNKWKVLNQYIFLPFNKSISLHSRFPCNFNHLHYIITKKQTICIFTRQFSIWMKLVIPVLSARKLWALQNHFIGHEIR